MNQKFPYDVNMDLLCCANSPLFGAEFTRVYAQDRGPNKNRDAGIDVSPAVRDFLGMSGMDSCDWRFASEKEIPPGPWRVSVSPEIALPRLLEGPENAFLLAERTGPLLKYSVNSAREILAAGAIDQRSDLMRERIMVYADSPDLAETVMDPLRR